MEELEEKIAEVEAEAGGSLDRRRICYSPTIIRYRSECLFSTTLLLLEGRLAGDHWE
jgi:hypothetical protein